MTPQAHKSSKSAVKENTPKKPRRTQQERRAETRGRLLEATIQLLREKGYSRFRILDAAAAAGVSRGGQTHHFSTKSELVEAAIEQVFESTVDNARIEADKTHDSSVLEHAVAHTSDFLHSSVYRFGVNMMISAGPNAHLADRIRTISRRNRPPIERAWIDRLVRSGVHVEKAEDVLFTLWSIQRGLVIDEIIGDETHAPNRLMEFAIDLMKDELNGAAIDPVAKNQT